MSSSTPLFVDSSALIAILDPRQSVWAEARAAWQAIVAADLPVVTTNYVLLETCSVIQRRSGVDAVKAFTSELAPLIEVIWVDGAVHEAGLAAVLAAARRRLGLVDCTSFEVMRRNGIKYVFAFDAHFAERGFTLPPLPEP